MEHLTLKATVTETDQELGTFSALVSGWDADRVGDVIDRHAFDQSLRDWRSSGKNLPLLYEHSHIAIGSLDPHTAFTDEQGLTIDGEVDRDTREGKQVWKQVKRGSVGFSIGFMTVKSQPREGEGNVLQVIDLIEVSATSSPMHSATRVTNWKSAATFEEMLTESERETYRQVRDEWKAKREAKAQAEEETISYSTWVPARDLGDDHTFSLMGMLVRRNPNGSGFIIVDR